MTLHSELEYKMMVCTNCWYTAKEIQREFPQGTAENPVLTTAEFEEGIMYFTPHRANCRRVS